VQVLITIPCTSSTYSSAFPIHGFIPFPFGLNQRRLLRPFFFALFSFGKCFSGEKAHKKKSINAGFHN
jgi:hypothetical protein